MKTLHVTWKSEPPKTPCDQSISKSIGIMEPIGNGIMESFGIHYQWILESSVAYLTLMHSVNAGNRGYMPLMQGLKALCGL